VYLPPDANCFLSTVHHCLKSKNYVNLIIGSKQPTPVYLSPSEAAEHCKLGASIWKWASTNEGADPDVVVVGIGVEVTFEVIKAVELLKSVQPKLRVRMVNVADLMVLAAETTHPHALDNAKFGELFTNDKPLLFNYHGYATELQGILFGRSGLHRMLVNGYREEGTTTTPFDMLLRNNVSRYDIATRALQAAAGNVEAVKSDLDRSLAEIESKVKSVREHISATGTGKFYAHLSAGRPERCKWGDTDTDTNTSADPDFTYIMAKLD